MVFTRVDEIVRLLYSNIGRGNQKAMARYLIIR